MAPFRLGRALRGRRALLLLALAGGTVGAIRFIQLDPAKDVVRVRLTIISRGSSVSVTTDDAVITNTAVENVDGGVGARPIVEGGRVGYTGNLPGLEVDASFRLTLAHVRGSRVTFRTTRGGPGGVALEVTNINDESSARAVDRFSAARRPPLSPATLNCCVRADRWSPGA